uniref:protein IQ-DOMAIN 10-like n=1 Tax=Erigeron canadensis TaxID=72917 RepID=UPI001CB948EA|nr:protein IQ-DOMAIN 10-like [Erigeron canadensis]
MGLWAWFKKLVCNNSKKQNKSKKLEARKSLHSSHGTSKIQAYIEADALTKQASSALDRIHFWSKIQTELRTRRLYMVKESRIKQKKRQNQLKIDSKFHELEIEWCNGPESMDEMANKIQQRGEATNKRERAMAYAFSHQWRASSSRSFGQAYYHLSKESCGWSWMERWIAVCPWEARVVSRPIFRSRGGQGGQVKKQGKRRTKYTKTKMLVTVKPQVRIGKGIKKANNNCTS